MTRATSILGLAVLVAVGLGAGYMGWRAYRSARESACDVCMRPIHVHTKTTAEVGGRREVFCCPTCALAAARQSGEALRFVEFTDYISHDALAPDDAFLVRGSDVNPCIEHDHEMVRDPERMSVPIDYDRCSPSLLAFANRSTAEEFIRNRGGELLRPEDLQEDAAR